MRHPRVLIYEKDGRLAASLQNHSDTAPLLRKTQTLGEVGAHNWALRQPRTLEACLRLLQSAGPVILVVNVAGKSSIVASAEDRAAEQRRRERAFHLLERAAWLRPEAAIVAVGDVAEETLAGLAWELGAAYVLFPPQPTQLFPLVLSHLMRTLAAPRREVP